MDLETLHRDSLHIVCIERNFSTGFKQSRGQSALKTVSAAAKIPFLDSPTTSRQLSSGFHYRGSALNTKVNPVLPPASPRGNGQFLMDERSTLKGCALSIFYQ